MIRPSSPSRRGARARLLVLGALLPLWGIGCVGGPGSSESGSRGESVGPGPTRAGGPVRRPEAPAEGIRWSVPITYHGVEVRFQLLPTGEPSPPQVRRSEFGDSLTCGGIALQHEFGRFRAAGDARYDLREGSRVFVFRPPSPSAPWRTQGEGFRFTWEGNAASPVVREDRLDGTIIWTFRRSTLTLERGGVIVHRHRRNERRLPLPVALAIEPDGSIGRIVPGGGVSP